MLTETFNEDTTEVVDESLVASYAIRRSIASFQLYTVVALDKEGTPLFIVESDVDFDIAQKLVDEFSNTN